MWIHLLLLGACDSGYPEDPEELLSMASLEVEPAEATLYTSPEDQATQTFTAWAVFEDGERYEAEFVEWSVSNETAGSVGDAGEFTCSPSNGGVTWVTAAYASHEAQATVTVIYTDVINEDGVDTTLFDGEAASFDASPWLYPEDQVALPRNAPSTYFQWEDLGATAYRLQFTSSLTDIIVYTTENGWDAFSDEWQVIAGTNAGGEVEVSLQAVVDGQLYAADPITLQVERFDARGSIYYWSSHSLGVKHIPYGGEAEEWYGISETDGYCIGCHAISIGTDPLLAVSSTAYWEDVADPDEPDDGYLEIFDLESLDPILERTAGETVNFKSFTHDGEYMLGTLHGTLMLYNGRTGEYLGDVTPYDDSAGEAYKVAHAEWSPDDSQVALTLAGHMGTDVELHGARLGLMDHLGDGSFGTVEILVDPDTLYPDEERIAYYPAWSPDGEWLAFNISSGDSYDDVDAQIWVIPASGEGDPVSLDAANRESGLTNSWPRWGPLPDDDILWLTFSSRRDYGHQATEGEPQIWVTSFDPEKYEAGQDPSTPAYWLAGQDVEENNHVPVWIE